MELTETEADALKVQMQEWVGRQAKMLRHHGFDDCPRCGAKYDTLLFDSCTGTYVIATCLSCNRKQVRKALVR